uniref:Uncharacterized protein n=1 Tax=Cyprinus carpio TaxID=7962 RepID=A0A8C1Z419_CYPCA
MRFTQAVGCICLLTPSIKTICGLKVHQGYDQARGRTRVNIGAAFQRWRELKEREGLESDQKLFVTLQLLP